MGKALVPVSKGALVPVVQKGWLDTLRRYLPARWPSHAMLPPSRHRATLSASHEIPLGFKIEADGERLREVWIRYGIKHKKSFITIAPARSGKGATQLVQEIGACGGMIGGVAPSLVINDLKAELIPICGRARYELGDRVFKVDPFGLAAPSPYVIDGAWNPLEGRTPYDTTDIKNLSAGLLVMEGTEPHFIHRPRQLLQCLMAHVCDDSNNEPATLPYIMSILGLPDAAFTAYMERLAESPIDFVRTLAGPFCADTKENRAIVSSAIGQLDFMNDANIARVLSSRSSFKWSDLKRGGISVFFSLPEKVAATFGRFSRLFWTSCIGSLYQPPFHPVLLVIDEASSSLGSSMELFEHAFALGSGFGLRLHLIFQNLPQLRNLFQEQADSIISSAGVTQWFRPNDRQSAQYLMQRAGSRTESFLTETTSISENYGENGHASTGANTSFGRQYIERPLWTEQQLY